LKNQAHGFDALSRSVGLFIANLVTYLG